MIYQLKIVWGLQESEPYYLCFLAVMHRCVRRIPRQVLIMTARLLLVLCVLVATVAAFRPTARAVVTRSIQGLKMEYIPDGNAF